ncbi:hypothetical protein ACHAQH_008290 [Verticillium albo-atrum]
MTGAIEPPSNILKRAGSIWDCEETGEDGIIWPKDPKEAGQTRIRALLKERKDAMGGTHGWTEVRAGDLDYTAFYYVNNMRPVAEAYFDSDQVKEINRAYNFRADLEPRLTKKRKKRNQAKRSRQLSDKDSILPTRDDVMSKDKTGTDAANVTEISDANAITIQKRATSPETTDKWHLSHISIPERVNWNVDNAPHEPSQNKFAYYFDNREGAGQTIYIMEERTGASGEFTGQLKAPLTPHSYLTSMWYNNDPDDATEMRRHGTVISAMIGGTFSGIARQASLVVVPTKLGADEDWPLEIFLASLVAISNDIVKEKKPKDTTVVNMSFGIPMKDAEPRFWTIMRELMALMEAKYGTVFVAASGNAEPDLAEGPLVDPGVFVDENSMPYEAMPYVPGMMVVGASNREGYRRKLSMVGTNVEFWAPSEQLPYPLGVSTRRQINGGSPADGQFTPPSNPGATGPGWVPPPPVTLPNLPTLPPSDPGVTPGPGQVCLSSATVTQCNGRPGQAVCVTSTSCASFGTLGPFPPLPPTVTSPPGGVCVSTATWVITGGPKGEATVTTSGCGKWTVPSAPEPTPNPPPPPPPPERNHGIVVISYYEFGSFTVGGTF